MESGSLFVFSYQKNTGLSFKIEMIVSTGFAKKILDVIFVRGKVIEIFIS